MQTHTHAHTHTHTHTNTHTHSMGQAGAEAEFGKAQEALVSVVNAVEAETREGRLNRCLQTKLISRH